MDKKYTEESEGVRKVGTACSSNVNNACPKDEGCYKDDKLGRVCRSCETWKPWNEFDKKKTGKNGFDSRCKTCISESKKKKNRELNKKKQKSDKARKSRKTTVLDISNFTVIEEWLPVMDGCEERILGDYIGDVICKRMETS